MAKELIEGLMDAGPQASVFSFGPFGAGAWVYSPGQTEPASLKLPVSKLASLLQSEFVAILITLNFQQKNIQSFQDFL